MKGKIISLMLAIILFVINFIFVDIEYYTSCVSASNDYVSITGYLANMFIINLFFSSFLIGFTISKIIDEIKEK